jgi:hypothetical protein
MAWPQAVADGGLEEVQNARQQETGVEREGSKESVDLIYEFHPLYLLL